MRLLLFLTAILTISMTVQLILSSLDSNVYAVTANTTDFSVNVSNNWAYAKLQLPDAEGSGILLIPTEFSDSLMNTRDFEKLFQNLSVYSTMVIDTSYPFRNVPLEIYVEHWTNVSSDEFRTWPTWFNQNITIDGEKALKINLIIEDEAKATDMYLGYYVFHDGIPYRLEYYASVKDFGKYLPQFEQMVKTFVFVK